MTESTSLRLPSHFGRPLNFVGPPLGVLGLAVPEHDGVIHCERSNTIERSDKFVSKCVYQILDADDDGQSRLAYLRRDVGLFWAWRGGVHCQNPELSDPAAGLYCTWLSIVRDLARCCGRITPPRNSNVLERA